MSTDWTDSKKWQQADRVTEMLAAIAKINPDPPGALAEAIPELVAVLNLQKRGIGDTFEAVHKITRYNQATHEQFAQQIEVIRTLVQAVKTQDKQIAKLTRRVESLEKKQAAKKEGARAAKAKKKLGWFR